MADRRQMYEYKGDCCAHCGLSVREMLDRFGTVERVFQLHHVDPSSKSPDYSNLIRRNIFSRQIDELDKCILLCNVCHGVVHAQDMSANLQLTVSLDGKSASQSLRGNVILDKSKQTATFRTNQRVEVVPYLVGIGDARPELLFGTDLARGRKLERLLRDLPHVRTLSISRYSDRRLMLSAEYLGERQIRVRVELSCPLFAAELAEAMGTDTSIWVRNGVALTRDGKIMHSGLLSLDMTLT